MCQVGKELEDCLQAATVNPLIGMVDMCLINSHMQDNDILFRFRYAHGSTYGYGSTGSCQVFLGPDCLAAGKVTYYGHF